MPAQCRVTVIREVTQPLSNKDTLCLQKVIYVYHDGDREIGYRFIRRDRNGRLKAQRGGANCVSLRMIKHMLKNYTNAYEAVEASGAL